MTETEKSQLASTVLNRGIREKISAAGFEASAISAAIAMEQQAIKVYSEQAENASDPEEKKLYAWLTDWERQHLNRLMDIDRALLDSVWEDNHFWPF
jgi:rubrerythrin